MASLLLLLRWLPSGRYGQPEEVAGLVRFLALDPGEPTERRSAAGTLARGPPHAHCYDGLRDPPAA